MHEPQSTRWKIPIFHLVHCGSWIAAANSSARELRLVDCGSWIAAPPQQAWKRCNISPFIRSPKYKGLHMDKTSKCRVNTRPSDVQKCQVNQFRSPAKRKQNQNRVCVYPTYTCCRYRRMCISTSVLCISTSKWVLCMLFTGQNNYFGVKTSFPYFPSQTEKREESAKNYKKNMNKKGFTSNQVLFLKSLKK